MNALAPLAAIRADLTLGELYAALGDCGDTATLAEIASRVHVRRSLVRWGMLRLVALRGVEREERDEEILYHRIRNATFGDESVRAPDKDSGPAQIDAERIGSRGLVPFQRRDGSESGPSLARLAADEREIGDLRGVLFTKAADAAATIAEGLVSREGSAVDTVARALAIAAQALVEAAEMMQARAAVAAGKVAAPKARR